MSNNIKIPKSTKDVLKMALEMEDEGYRTYTEGSKTVKNSLGKRMLEKLAKEELNHIQRIKEVYEALEGKRDWESVTSNQPEGSVTFASIFNRLKADLKQSVDEMGSSGVDDEEVIDTAINLESNAKFFYSESAKKAKDSKVKEFLGKLALEEEGHYNALMNMNNFMTDPANWFATQGKF